MKGGKKKSKVEELVESESEDVELPVPQPAVEDTKVEERVQCDKCGDYLKARSVEYTHSRACRMRVVEPEDDVYTSATHAGIGASTISC